MIARDGRPEDPQMREAGGVSGQPHPSVAPAWSRQGEADRKPVPVPAPVARLAAGRAVREVWQNELGGRTFEVGAGAGRYFVKWTPAGGIDLSQEAARLEWAGPYITVPRVIGQGADGAGSWLVTSALPGQNAVARRWRDEPAKAVAAIGEGLRAMHEAMPVALCPFSWTAQDQVADARRRAGLGHLDPARWHEIHQGLTVEQALTRLADIPPADRLVVGHGDACAPNTLITEDGRCSGHVDLGDLGVADRWADLAVATWSTEWNYGPAGMACSSTPTAFRPTRSAPGTTASCGILGPDGPDGIAATLSI
jgi:kanamycin kinase